MWFMPSYGRPEALRRMEEAPGGLPAQIVVLVNEDDPQRDAYFDAARETSRWIIRVIPAGSRCADAHRWITTQDDFFHCDFYGLLCDDQWPITPGWHDACVAAAGDRRIVTPAGEPSFPKLRNVVVFGGALVRAMGSLVPPGFRHNYEDNVWDQIAEDFSLLVGLDDVFVEHRHWIRGQADKDATYERGSHDMQQDADRFASWLRSEVRVEMSKRVAAFLGVGLTEMDMRGLRLVILVAHADYQSDWAFEKSLQDTVQMCGGYGVSVKIVRVGGGSHVGKTRERLLWNAWHDAGDFTHLLWVDDDMSWDARGIVNLIASDHEFCALVGMKKFPGERVFCANFDEGNVQFHPKSRFAKLKSVGFGIVVLKRCVIERMIAAYPDLRYVNDDGREEWALFLDMIDGTQRLSEDLSFCTRWARIGGEMYADHDALVHHYGRYDFSGRLMEVFKPAAVKQAAE